MAVYKLVLYPELKGKQRVSVEQARAIIAALRDTRFLAAEELQVDGRVRYLLGDACLSQLTFLGCSPHIELDPPRENPGEAAQKGAFCHLTLTRLDQPQWRVDPTAKPRCPSCRKAVRQQELRIADQLTCPKCGETTRASDWQWRNLGARASFFLDIWGVFTAEAVPNPPLLATLESVLDVEWRYFYVKD